MHLIKDETGHLVSHAHGDEHEHTHEHADGSNHSHVHTHEQGHEHTHEHSHECNCKGGCDGNCKDETVALLTYMVQHNEHHAQELDQMVVNLRKLGMEEAAKTIEEGVCDFQKGNMRLSLALTLVKAQ